MPHALEKRVSFNAKLVSCQSPYPPAAPSTIDTHSPFILTSPANPLRKRRPLLTSSRLPRLNFRSILDSEDTGIGSKVTRVCLRTSQDWRWSAIAGPRAGQNSARRRGPSTTINQTRQSNAWASIQQVYSDTFKPIKRIQRTRRSLEEVRVRTSNPVSAFQERNGAKRHYSPGGRANRHAWPASSIRRLKCPKRVCERSFGWLKRGRLHIVTHGPRFHLSLRNLQRLFKHETAFPWVSG